jgi:leucyl-tRNA synthetase
MSGYQFRDIEAKWQKYWAKHKTFKAKQPQDLETDKDPFYVLDMFPYPSGAGLHVGHPLGYIASDIYARYKRHQGYNVLHPQGYDSFGLPAEQYAIQTGQHPAKTTQTNIKRYREQLDRIGFSFDWDREVRTSDPNYYKWTQWIFIQLFESYYDYDVSKAKPISELVEIFQSHGNTNLNVACDEDKPDFSSEDWQSMSEKDKEKTLLKYRLTYLAETEVNWCPALGTVLANDEIINGLSERGGHPVERKKMKQWSMRISAYAERLLQGLDQLDWSESIKDSQRNWIGKSVGSQVEFPILTFPSGEGTSKQTEDSYVPGYMTGGNNSHLLIQKAKDNRKDPTQAEAILWSELKGKKLDGYKFRQQHLIDDFIVDFVCLKKGLIVEVDGKYHDDTKEYDAYRTNVLKRNGFKVIRFKNENVLSDLENVLNEIENQLKTIKKDWQPQNKNVSPIGAGGNIPPLGARGISVFTTRPDTIFGVSFMTLAPEHELVTEITTPDQKEAVENYITETAKRSERDRLADVKTITGVFTGAYAEHPFTKEPIPIWIGDYVLASYGTGAVMAVPCGDQRDYDFAKHFDIPIPNIFKDTDISNEAFGEKDDTQITNSDFLNGLSIKQAIPKAIEVLEEQGFGTSKTNYRLRDAVFSRQRYWGEPFPVYYVNGLPKMIENKFLPLELPEVEKYLPTETGEPPLGRAEKWYWLQYGDKAEIVSKDKFDSSPLERLGEEKLGGALELNTMPGWAGSSWYMFRYMETENRDEVFASEEALDYWKNVNLYVGGSEHATGHLLYSRFWTKFLKDRGCLKVDEPFQRMVNQGMILGESAFVHRIDFVDVHEMEFIKDSKNKVAKLGKKVIELPLKNQFFISFYPNWGDFEKNKKTLSNEEYELVKKSGDILRKGLLNYLNDNFHKFLDENKYSLLYKEAKVHCDVNLVNTSNELDIEGFQKFRPEFKDAIFIGKDGKVLSFGEDLGEDSNGGSFLVSREVEKMSKSKYNVINPDDVCDEYGADALRLFEMFLGPIDQAKPWNTAGLSGVVGFLKKLWKLYHQGENGSFYVQDSPTSEGLAEALKVLHQTIKKVNEDIEGFSFNTSVSAFMICVNELLNLKCSNRKILEPLCVLLSPFAPHICEEIWEKLGHKQSVEYAPYPVHEEKYLVEDTKTYPISFNGKMRYTLDLDLSLSKDEIEKIVMADERTQKQLDGRTPKKVIIVPGKIVNIVG